MRTRILSLAIALLVILSIGLAYANHEQWTKDPCVSGSTITGMATGLGTGPYYLHITGEYDCVNKGTKTPQSANWSDLDIVIPVYPKAQGGNFKVTATIPSQCDHANWTFITRDLEVTIYRDAALTIEVIEATAVNPC